MHYRISFQRISEEGCRVNLDDLSGILDLAWFVEVGLVSWIVGWRVGSPGLEALCLMNKRSSADDDLQDSEKVSVLVSMYVDEFCL